jgi:hypothetical protein
MMNKPGVSCRDDRFLQPLADETPTKIRITRAVLAPLYAGGSVQACRAGLELTLPYDVAVRIIEAGRAELI